MTKTDQKTPLQIIEKSQSILEGIDLDQKHTQLLQLQEKTSQPDFWSKPEAQQTVQSISVLENEISQAEELTQLIDDLTTYLSLQSEQTDEDSDQNTQVEDEVRSTTKKLEQLTKQLQLKIYLNGKFDSKPALVSIHAGQGGTEAMDWAEMLKRMYVRFFERKNWKHVFVSESRGEDAGIKSASFEVHAPNAYGFLRGEHGTHRLVRLSPFNADNLRQTSFALVEVLPIIDDPAEVELNDSDLSWNFTRAGGAGGQSVNKVNSAVELTHAPSGITVKCREERSQAQNKERALKILKAKLAKIQEEASAMSLAKEKGEHHQASWGTQIRNYVLHPYQMVKDTRTQHETTNTKGVLDGDIEGFIEAEILER